MRVVGGDAPGVLVLESDAIRVRESHGKAVLTLRREEGSRGAVSCVVHTRDGSAVAPADYDALDGEEVHFKDGETVKKGAPRERLLFSTPALAAPLMGQRLRPCGWWHGRGSGRARAQ